MKSRIIFLFLFFAILISCCPIVYAGIEYRRPVNDYYSEQNPPDFSWRHTNGATYDIVVATDYELTDVRYKEEGLKKNIYNFTTEFEPGVGINYLINVGSDHLGRIPEPSLDILKNVR